MRFNLRFGCFRSSTVTFTAGFLTDCSPFYWLLVKTSTSWTEVDQWLAFLALLHGTSFLQELSFHSDCRPSLATHQPSSFDVRLHSGSPTPPSLNPPSFLLCFPTFSSHLPRLSQNSSSAPPVGVCRLRRTRLTGSGRRGDGYGSCSWRMQPSSATGDLVPEREPPDGLCLNHFTTGSARWAPYGIRLHIWILKADLV